MKLTDKDIILQTIVSIVLPFAFMLGIFVILNGHISPGGGFSGGVIFGASFILHDTAFGHERTQKYLNFKSIVTIGVVSLNIYGLLKAFSFITGAAGIATNIPLGQIGNILSAGFILPLNICVGLIVSTSMYLFFSLYMRGDI